jgi:hypothetical protein
MTPFRPRLLMSCALAGLALAAAGARLTLAESEGCTKVTTQSLGHCHTRQE